MSMAGFSMKGFTKVLQQTAAKVEKSITESVRDVTGPKHLQDYDIGEQVGSAGPGLFWKLYKATPKSKTGIHAGNSEVCIWFLDKKNIVEKDDRKISKSAVDQLLDLYRADASQLLKLRHPGVVRVIAPLDESKHAMAMVTEPVFCSLANALKKHDNIKTIPRELKELELSELEKKHGLLQLTESLSFLHDNARLVHRALNPEAVIITASGAWKLAAFGFAAALDKPTDSDDLPPFLYPEFDNPDPPIPSTPNLDYVAPELTRRGGASVSGSDMFSLGALSYHAFTGNLLLNTSNNLKAYTSTTSYLHMRELPGTSAELAYEIRRLMSSDASQRPSASDFGSSGWFRDDVRLRALRFLDHMLERDNMQKADFLKSLTGMWQSFDSRVLRYKVLPPLAAELRNAAMQQQILPMIMSVAEVQDAHEFELSTLPHLLPVMQSGQGDVLLLLVKSSPMLYNQMPESARQSHLLPMMVRAFEDADSRIQEEVLKKSVQLAQKFEYQVLKQSFLPRVHSLALKTSVAAVRVNALICLGELVPRLDKQAITDVLTTLQRCSAVDHSAPTLMCVLGVADVIAKANGIEYCVEFILPMLVPLTTASQLSQQQLTKYMKVIYGMLKRVEEKRGITVDLSEPTSPTKKPPPTAVPPKRLSNGAPPSSTEKVSWDQDWGNLSKAGPVGSALSPPPPQAPSPTPPAFEWPRQKSTPPSTSGPSSGNLGGSMGLGSSILGGSSGLGSAVLGSSTLASTPDLGGASWDAFGGGGATTSGGGSGGVSRRVSSTGDLSGQAESDPFAEWPPRSSGSDLRNSVPPSSSYGAPWSMGGRNLGASSISSSSPLSANEWLMPTGSQSNQHGTNGPFAPPQPMKPPPKIPTLAPPSSTPGAPMNAMRRTSSQAQTPTANQSGHLLDLL